MPKDLKKTRMPPMPYEYQTRPQIMWNIDPAWYTAQLYFTLLRIEDILRRMEERDRSRI